MNEKEKEIEDLMNELERQKDNPEVTEILNKMIENRLDELE